MAKIQPQIILTDLYLEEGRGVDAGYLGRRIEESEGGGFSRRGLRRSGRSIYKKELQGKKSNIHILLRYAMVKKKPNNQKVLSNRLHKTHKRTQEQPDKVMLKLCCSKHQNNRKEKIE